VQSVVLKQRIASRIVGPLHMQLVVDRRCVRAHVEPLLAVAAPMRVLCVFAASRPPSLRPPNTTNRQRPVLRVRRHGQRRLHRELRCVLRAWWAGCLGMLHGHDGASRQPLHSHSPRPPSLSRRLVQARRPPRLQLHQPAAVVRGGVDYDGLMGKPACSVHIHTRNEYEVTPHTLTRPSLSLSLPIPTQKTRARARTARRLPAT
jgi:hypothetical protein